MKRTREIEYINKIIINIENPVIKDRVENVLIWNANKANRYKFMYYTMSILIIIINGSIPVINQIANFDSSKLVVSTISAIAGALASILTLIGIKDKWYRYRKYAELLKTECFLFTAKCGVYAEEGREDIFIKNFEAICSDETKLWEKLFFKTENQENLRGKAVDNKSDSAINRSV